MYQVLRNRQGRHSLWPAHKGVPSGWQAVFARGNREECLEYVRRSWLAVAVASPRQARPSMQFSLMFFGGGEENVAGDKYRLVLESARFADEHGFAAVWLPERHFTRMGCLYPNPALLHAAVARETRRIALRAGSVVLPLHHPLRVAEDWAVVDNLSGGRVGVSFAPGWNPADFCLCPGKYERRYEELYTAIPVIDRLWAGHSVAVTGGDGKPAEVRVYPTPVQRQLPKWITAAGSPRSFEKAGELGVNLLTHLFDQGVEEIGRSIRLYRDSRRKAGHDPDAGHVTVALHTFLAATLDEVREHAHPAYAGYLKANAKLLESFAVSRGLDIDMSKLSPEQLDEAVHYLFEKFFRKRSLLGTPESCYGLVEELAAVGVNEVACLIDFGPDPQAILASLPALNQLRERFAV